MEQMKKNLLVQDYSHSNDAGLSTKPLLEVCDTSTLTHAIKENLPTKVVSEKVAKMIHKPSLGISDAEYVQHVKNDNPGVIVIDLKPISENYEEKYDEYLTNVIIEPGEILEGNIAEKQAELHDKKQTVITLTKDIKTDLAMEFSPCTKCNKTYATKRRLRSHMQSCHETGAFCFKCGTFFASKKYMKRHLREVHVGFTFKCGKCSDSFKSKNTMDRHMSVCLIHEVQGINRQRMSRRCPMCPGKFYSKSSLKEHVWNIHQVPLQDSYLFNGWHSLDSRLSQPSQGQMTTKSSRIFFIFSCKVCDASFRRKWNLVAHSRTHHDGVQEQQNELLVCGFQGCTFSCRSKKVLNKHKLVGHKGDIAFNCIKCDKPFATNKDMLQHKARVHRGLAFNSPISGSCPSA